jgi:signal recognition particle subunit SEC65
MTNYHYYYLRCVEPDLKNLQELAVKLGLLVKTEEGYNPINCAWDEIGYIYEDTGTEGEPSQTIKANAEGVPYWHINLALDRSLGEVAETAYAKTKDKTLGAALKDIGRYFVVDPDTLKPVKPANPSRVYL